MKRSTIIIMILFLMCGCSIFDQRSPEPPLVGTQTEDPLNISHILNIVDESAVSMNYSDYFTPEVVFEYSYVSRITGRNNIVNMLNNLRSQATDVVWETNRATTRPGVGGAQIIEGLPYTVFLHGDIICRGVADFHVSRGLSWLISYWKDMPDGYAPFFEP